MKRLAKNLLLSCSVIAGSSTSIVTPSNAVTLAKAQGSLEFRNFSHIPQEVATFQSAFAYVATEQEFGIVTSNPMFVAGVPFMIHPLAPKFPASLTSQLGATIVTAPLAFNSVTGYVSGKNSLVYSEINSQNLLSVNLNSENMFSVGDTGHAVWTVGQSYFQSRFYLGTGEKFYFDFQSFFNQLDVATSYPQTEALKIEESQVIYFFSHPVDVDINQAILMFSLYPNLAISVNDPRIDVGLVNVVKQKTSNKSDSLEIFGNSNHLQFSQYFKLETQNIEDNFLGLFEYVAEEPKLLTIVSYISSEVISQRPPIDTTVIPEKPAQVPESSTNLHLLCLTLIGIGTRIKSNFF